MTQTARPVSDVSVSGWFPIPVYLSVNEPDPDDESFVAAVVPPGGQFEVRLADLADPAVLPCQPFRLTVRVGAAPPGAVALRVVLVQGGASGDAEVASWGVTPGWAFADHTFDLTPGQAAAITDFTNLRVRVEATGSSGSYSSSSVASSGSVGSRSPSVSRSGSSGLSISFGPRSRSASSSTGIGSSMGRWSSGSGPPSGSGSGSAGVCASDAAVDSFSGSGTGLAGRAPDGGGCPWEDAGANQGVVTGSSVACAGTSPIGAGNRSEFAAIRLTSPDQTVSATASQALAGAPPSSLFQIAGLMARYSSLDDFVLAAVYYDHENYIGRGQWLFGLWNGSAGPVPPYHATPIDYAVIDGSLDGEIVLAIEGESATATFGGHTLTGSVAAMSGTGAGVYMGSQSITGTNSISLSDFRAEVL